LSLVGPPGGHHFESDSGRVTYDYFEPSRCAFVSAVDAGDPADVARCLDQLLAAQPHRIEHLTLHVLADKRALIGRLCATPGASRFAMTAYVPAWYAEDEKRYDCAWLTARLDPRPLVRLGTDAVIRSLLTDLADCAAGTRWDGTETELPRAA
jgi:hypothetical protein